MVTDTSPGDGLQGVGAPGGHPLPEEPSVGYLAALLRLHGERDPQLGQLYRSMYAAAERLIEEFFPDVPVPTLSFDDCVGLGWWAVVDGFRLRNRINLNPGRHRTGEDLAETLAHELCHAWCFYQGLPIGHGPDFRRKAATVGLTIDAMGGHEPFTNAWSVWLTENEDLMLAHFQLPGGHDAGNS